MTDYSLLIFRVEAMTSQDIAAVMQIEQEAFSAPWSARAYDYELQYNEMAHYYVVRTHPGRGALAQPHVATPATWWQRLVRRDQEVSLPTMLGQNVILGYGGFWLMVDEAHISTIAAHHDWRRRGIGELLLVSMIDAGAEIGAHMVTLEVRLSNLNAQSLYRKYGFEVTGRRKGYYSDNGEDALIMSTPTITTAEFQRRIQGLKSKLFARLSR
jgi:[ribosomal protein S18]-alanine N-acetyltransferase